MNRISRARAGLVLALGGLLLVLGAGSDRADARSGRFWKVRVLNGGKADVLSVLAEIPVAGADFKKIKVEQVRPGCQKSARACGCLMADHIRLLLCVAPEDAPRSLQLVYPDDGDEGQGGSSIRWVNVIVGSGLDDAVSAQAIIHFWNGRFVVRPFRAVGGNPCGPEDPDPVVPGDNGNAGGGLIKPLEPHPFLRIRLRNKLPKPVTKVEVRGHRSPTAPGDTHVIPTSMPSTIWITSTPDQPNYANEVEICVLVDLNSDGDTDDPKEQFFLTQVLDNAACRVKRVDVDVDGTVTDPHVKAFLVLWPKPVGEPPCAPPEANWILELDVPEGECHFRPPPGEPEPPHEGG